MDSETSTKKLSEDFSRLYEGPLTDFQQCRQLVSAELDRGCLLRSIPLPATPSYRPLYLLYVLLTEVNGPWPPFDLIKTHTRLASHVSDSKSDTDEDISWVSDKVSQLVKNSYRSFADFIGNNARPALRTTDAQAFITHEELHNFVSTFSLSLGRNNVSPRVAIAIPNGALLAAACIAVTTYYTAAPINPAAGPEQFKADVVQSGAKFILTTPEEYTKLQLASWVAEEGIQIGFLEWAIGQDIMVRNVDGSIHTNTKSPRPNKPDDIALILFTSGTSGTKKVVPLTIHSIVAGVIFVMESWGLSDKDICLNMMPLYHV
jgi:long-subunit acyl-CoA synthetase (AMP-forming)